MMNSEWVIIIAVILLVILLRAFLVVLGIHKTPVLHHFERYGEEGHYSPMLDFILWAAINALYSLIFFLEMDHFLLLFIISLPVLVWLYRQVDEWVKRYPEFFARYPRWYYRMLVDASREERRRIAYLWLRLPVRTRLLYSARDEFFHQWVELVLLSLA